jgi:hypothetical protein
LLDEATATRELLALVRELLALVRERSAGVVSVQMLYRYSLTSLRLHR